MDSLPCSSLQEPISEPTQHPCSPMGFSPAVKGMGEVGSQSGTSSLVPSPCSASHSWEALTHGLGLSEPDCPSSVRTEKTDSHISPSTPKVPGTEPGTYFQVLNKHRLCRRSHCFHSGGVQGALTLHTLTTLGCPFSPKRALTSSLFHFADVGMETRRSCF